MNVSAAHADADADAVRRRPARSSVALRSAHAGRRRASLASSRTCRDVPKGERRERLGEGRIAVDHLVPRLVPAARGRKGRRRRVSVRSGASAPGAVGGKPRALKRPGDGRLRGGPARPRPPPGRTPSRLRSHGETAPPAPPIYSPRRVARALPTPAPYLTPMMTTTARTVEPRKPDLPLRRRAQAHTSARPSTPGTPTTTPHARAQRPRAHLKRGGLLPARSGASRAGDRRHQPRSEAVLRAGVKGSARPPPATTTTSSRASRRPREGWS